MYNAVFIYLFIFSPEINQQETFLTAKMISSAFFWHEIEEEFRERKVDWCFKGSDSDAMEGALSEINDNRQGQLYVHEDRNCSSLCKEKGNLPVSILSILSSLNVAFISSLKP